MTLSAPETRSYLRQNTKKHTHTHTSIQQVANNTAKQLSKAERLPLKARRGYLSQPSGWNVFQSDDLLLVKRFLHDRRESFTDYSTTAETMFQFVD